MKKNKPGRKKVLGMMRVEVALPIKVAEHVSEIAVNSGLSLTRADYLRRWILAGYEEYVRTGGESD